MGLVFLPRLREENLSLKEELKAQTIKYLDAMEQCVALLDELREYRSLGSIEYLRKLVDADKV